MHTSTFDQLPDFIINSTKNIALISCAILFPFIIINFIQQNHILALGIAGLFVLYLYAAYCCQKGIYNINLSLFGIAPVITGLSLYSLYSLGVSASFWSFAALFVLYFVLPIRLAAWFNCFFIAFLAPVGFSNMGLNEFTRFMLVIIGTSAFVFMCIREIYKQNELLVKLSLTDALTGLNNRATLNHSLVQAINLNQRYKTPVSLLIMDIDHFKKINDQFGHITGDHTLVGIAELMLKNFREADELFRIGGEEFLVLLHNADAAFAISIAERFRMAVETAELVPNHQVTVSIGVCERQFEESPQAWMSTCDKRLYRAKKEGRNKTISD